MDNNLEMNTIIYHITQDQIDLVARHYGLAAETISNLEEYEICELFDRYIDELN